MMKRIKKQKKGRPGTIISVYISLEAYDKLEELCEKYNTSRSRMIEMIIQTIHESVRMKEEEEAKKEQNEATDEATAVA